MDFISNGAGRKYTMAEATALMLEWAELRHKMVKFCCNFLGFLLSVYAWLPPYILQYRLEAYTYLTKRQ